VGIAWPFVAVEGPQRPPYTIIHQSARPTFSVRPHTQVALMGISIPLASNSILRTRERLARING
jgi:hypothetical protein